MCVSSFCTLQWIKYKKQNKLQTYKKGDKLFETILKKYKENTRATTKKFMQTNIILCCSGSVWCAKLTEFNNKSFYLIFTNIICHLQKDKEGL